MPRVTRFVILLAAVVVLLSGISVLILSDGPDRSITGRVSELERRDLCVEANQVVCVQSQSPVLLRGIRAGDCVRARYSSDYILISVERVTGACAEQPSIWRTTAGSVRFATAAEWVDRLTLAHASGALHGELRRLGRYPVFW